MKLPKYLKKNSFNIYHFRIKVPKRLIKIVGKTEICKSLKTTCEATARHQAYILAQETTQRFKDAEVNLNSASAAALHNVDFRAVGMSVAESSQLKQQENFGNALKKKQILLSEMIKKFVQARESDGAWRPNELRKNKRALEQMNEYLGDKLIHEYSKSEARGYRDKVVQLPKRTGGKSDYLGLSLRETIRKKPKNAPTISLSTANKYIEICSSAYDWAKEEYITGGNPFKGLRFGKRAMKRLGAIVRADKQRNMLSDADIDQLFSGLPMNVLRPRKVSYPLDYWGILIAAYSGARASEIAQLLVSDIVKIHDIYCFQFANDLDENEDFDANRSQKSENSLRVVPVHQILIDYGWLEYVQTMENEARLFPQEVPVDQKFGHRFSKDFSTYRKDMDVDGKGQTLHGFRHSHATKMREAGVDPLVISELHGRARGNDETTLRYIKIEKVREFNDAIQSVVYENATRGLLHWNKVKNKFITYERIDSKYRHDKKKGGLK